MGKRAGGRSDGEAEAEAEAEEVVGEIMQWSQRVLHASGHTNIAGLPGGVAVRTTRISYTYIVGTLHFAGLRGTRDSHEGGT
jgi:hydroxypyruvate isomerase